MTRTITFMLTKMFAAMIVVAMIVSSAAAQETVWLSTSGPGQDPGAPPVGTNGNVTINLPGVTLGSSKTLYIWSTDGTPVTPNLAPSGLTNFPNSTPPSTAYFAYDMNVTTDTGAISFTAASIANPTIGSTNVDQSWTGSSVPATRWLAASSFTSANTSNLTASTVTGMDASSNPVKAAAGGVNANYQPGLSTTPNTGGDTAGTTFGQYYNATQHAFLVGQVTFTINTTTSTAQIHLNQSNVNTITGQSNFGIGTAVSQGSASPWTPAYTVSDAKFNNGGGATGFAAGTGTATLNITTGVATRPGDFTGQGGPNTGVPDGTINGQDIDWLRNELVAGATFATHPELDVTGNGVVDVHDLDHEVGSLVDIFDPGTGLPTGAHGTHYGDANLDAIVNGTDVSNVFGHWQEQNAPWADGNVNNPNDLISGIDAIVNGTDISTIFGNWQAQNGSGQGAVPGGIAAVPEPSSLLLFGLGAAVCAVARRATRRKSSNSL